MMQGNSPLDAEYPVAGGYADDPDTLAAGQRNWRNLFPDPVALWVIFRRHLRLFLSLFALTLACVGLWTILQKPIYLATSSLLVRPLADNVVDVKAVSPELPATSDVVNTQVRLLQSAALAARVAERYAREHPGNALVKETSPGELPTAVANMAFISRSASTYVIDVDVRSSDPEQAADIANLYVTEFVAADKEAKVGTNTAANDWLIQRTKQLEAAAKSADAELQNYKIRNGLISAGDTSFSEQEISVFNQQIAAAQADLAEKQGRLSSARQQLARGGGGADVGAALGSGTIGTLRSREAEANARLAQLTSRFGAMYPERVRAEAELKAIKSDIQLEIDRILSNLQAEVNVSASRLASLQASRAQSTGVLSNNNRAEVGLLELQRRADAAKAIYETFLNRSRETSAQQGLQRADSQVASLAETPTSPDFPNRRLAALFGLVGGLAAGLLGIGVAEYTQRGLRTKADVEERLGLRYAGAVPTLESTLGPLKSDEAAHDYVLSHPQSSFTEAFRSLKTFVWLGSRGAPTGQRAVAITSALPQEGKTTTSVCLARIAALDGTPTILVDCDLRRRGASQLLGYTAKSGIAEVLTGGSIDDAIFVDEASGLHVIGSAGRDESAEDAGDPISPEAIERLLAKLRDRYQLIIIDTAPLLALADARIVAASVDRVLMICRWRKTSIHASAAAVGLLENSGARISGAALTQVDITAYASTGYSDSYSYHRQFRGYYNN